MILADAQTLLNNFDSWSVIHAGRAVHFTHQTVGPKQNIRPESAIIGLLSNQVSNPTNNGFFNRVSTCLTIRV